MRGQPRRVYLSCPYAAQSPKELPLVSSRSFFFRSSSTCSPLFFTPLIVLAALYLSIFFLFYPLLLQLFSFYFHPSIPPSSPLHSSFPPSLSFLGLLIFLAHSTVKSRDPSRWCRPRCSDRYRSVCVIVCACLCFSFSPLYPSLSYFLYSVLGYMWEWTESTYPRFSKTCVIISWQGWRSSPVIMFLGADDDEEENLKLKSKRRRRSIQ